MADALLDTFRRRLAQEAGDALYREIEAACAARRDTRGGHADWARLCEDAGLFNLAFREWQLATRDAPDDPATVLRLVHCYRERGDLSRAARGLELLLARHPAQETWLTLLLDILAEEGAVAAGRAALERAVEAGLPPERVGALRARLSSETDEPAQESPLTPTEADLIRFQGLFAGREDTHARQWARPSGETGYSPVREPLTPAVVRNHLLGTYTVGTYPIRLDGTSTFFALDLDITRASLERAVGEAALARQLREAMRGEGRRLLGLLREMGLEPLFEDSGYKGRHLWVFLDQPETAEVLHHLGRLMLARLTPTLAEGLHLEYFPKQPALKSQAGLGNLIKLPLGIHRRTGRRAALLDDAGQPVSDPLAVLRRVRRVPRETLYALIERLKRETPLPSTPASPSTAEAPAAPAVEGPPPPEPRPAWTDADFEADPRMSHLLQHCPVLAELKRQVDTERRLGHEEQLVLIHTLGHLPGGPQAVNYLLSRCVDVAAEKHLKSALRGNPVSCPSIRKKIGHVTRRVACHCSFPQAPDRYPTPALHLIGLPMVPPPAPTAPEGLEDLARRYGVLTRRRDEIQHEWEEMRRTLVERLRRTPAREIACPGGRYRLIEAEGVEELRWEADHANAGDHGSGGAAASGGGTAGDASERRGGAARAPGGGA